MGILRLKQMIDPDEFAETMAEIGNTHMPFGKYGPEKYPPKGLPIHQLPFEYLEWFQYNGGLPGGRLGELLELVYHIKKDGAGEVFAPLRHQSGQSLRKKPGNPRQYRFDQ